MTDLKQVLFEGFEYDLWANRQWLNGLGGFQQTERALKVLEHIAGAQRVWLERCGVVLPLEDENCLLGELFQACSAAWRELIGSESIHQTVNYVNLAGQPFSRTLEQIARHVINHGTYHRGHLRGLAMAEGWDEFPETDLILYFRELESAV